MKWIDLPMFRSRNVLRILAVNTFVVNTVACCERIHGHDASRALEF